MSFRTIVIAHVALTIQSDRPLTEEDVAEAMFEMNYEFDFGDGLAVGDSAKIVHVAGTEIEERTLVLLNDA